MDLSYKIYFYHDQWCSMQRSSFLWLLVLYTLWSISLYLLAIYTIVFDATYKPVDETSKFGFWPDLDNIIWICSR